MGRDGRRGLLDVAPAHVLAHQGCALALLDRQGVPVGVNVGEGEARVPSPANRPGLLLGTHPGGLQVEEFDMGGYAVTPHRRDRQHRPRAAVCWFGRFPAAVDAEPPTVRNLWFVLFCPERVSLGQRTAAHASERR